MRAFKQFTWKKIIFIIICLVWVLFFLSHKEEGKSFTGKRLVEITKKNGKFQLLRNGQPYFVKGAAVTDYSLLHKIKECGGNSIRLYNTENAQAILDSAHKLGLTVTLGLSLGYANKDMDYSNKEAVQEQLERLRKDVLKYKDHPALLMWGIGNEVSIFLGSRFNNFFAYWKLWKEIDKVAEMVHELDPDHPTTIVIPGGSTSLVQLTEFFCDHIDIISLNVSQDLGPIVKFMRDHWNGPYIISELATSGYWSSKKTDWYSSVEQTSYYKAQYIKDQYPLIQSSADQCLGSYVFLWGHKQEYTSTWYGFFSPHDQETEMTDACRYLWTGKEPQNSAAGISYILVADYYDQKQNIYLQPGKNYTVNIHTINDISSYACLQWELQMDGLEYLDASYTAQHKYVLKDSVVVVGRSESSKMPVENKKDIYFEFETPRLAGPYRLFVYLENEHGKVSTANACFYVHN